MRKLEVPQTYTPAPSDKDADPPVIAVQPAGSAKAAFATVISLDSIMAASFAHLAATAPALAEVLCQLIDELDGLGYRNADGLMPLAGPPFWDSLPFEWPDADAAGRPSLDAVAEWLHDLDDDAQAWWGGLEVTTDRGYWQLGDPRPVRAVLAGAATCQLTQCHAAAKVTDLILSRLPKAQSQELRQRIADVQAVNRLAAPRIDKEVNETFAQFAYVQELGDDTIVPPLLPPDSARPRLPITIDYLLYQDTPANTAALTGATRTHHEELQRFVLLTPLDSANAALDEAVPPESDARYLLDGVVLADRELASPVLRIADHLDGLARMTMMGPIPMLGIILHAVLSRLVRSGKTQPWDQVAAFEQGLRTTFFHHLLCVRVETPSGGTWTAGGSVRLGDVLAGQKCCTISRPEEPYRMIGHAGLDWRIAEDLFRRRPR